MIKYLLIILFAKIRILCNHLKQIKKTRNKY